jgi:hypothetical protein
METIMGKENMKLGDVLTSEKTWIKGYAATNAENIAVHPRSEEAVQFCLLGAVNKAADGNCRERAKLEEAAVDAAVKLGYLGIRRFTALVAFNDDAYTKWEDVQKLVKLADKYNVWWRRWLRNIRNLFRRNTIYT